MKIFNKLGITNDKAKHFVVGAAVAFVLSFFVANIWILSVVAALGIGKELYDLISKKGHAEAADAFVTVAGGVLVIFSTQFLSDFKHGWLLFGAFAAVVLVVHFWQKILK